MVRKKKATHNIVCRCDIFTHFQKILEAPPIAVTSSYHSPEHAATHGVHIHTPRARGVKRVSGVLFHRVSIYHTICQHTMFRLFRKNSGIHPIGIGSEADPIVQTAGKCVLQKWFFKCVSIWTHPFHRSPSKTPL